MRSLAACECHGVFQLFSLASFLSRWERRPGLLQLRSRSTLARMKLRLVVERDPKTKRWSAFFPELPGCATAGDTEAETVRNAKEALDLWFEPSPVALPKGAKVLEVALV